MSSSTRGDIRQRGVKVRTVARYRPSAVRGVSVRGSLCGSGSEEVTALKDTAPTKGVSRAR